MNYLSILGCTKLKKLPEEMHNILSSLQYSRIDGGPQLGSFLEYGTVHVEFSQQIGSRNGGHFHRKEEERKWGQSAQD